MFYRRVRLNGGTYFFTLNLNNRSSSLLTDNADVLRDSIRRVHKKYPFRIIAMVILPEHLHSIWTLPLDDDNYPLRWSLIKASFSRSIPKAEFINPSRARKRERGVWQRRYWEHQIRDDGDLENHVDYIHFNPVKHGYVNAAVDWPYSTIHHYIKQATLPANWASNTDFGRSNFGETNENVGLRASTQPTTKC